MRKVQFLFFRSFLLVLTKFLLWEEDQPLGDNSMKFEDCPGFSLFPKNLVRQLVRQLVSTSLLPIRSTTKKSQNIMNMNTVYRTTSMQKCDHNFIEITLLRGYSSVSILQVCSRMPFLENPSGELLLYIVLNIEIINVEVLSRHVKSYLKYISIIEIPFQLSP